MTPQSLDDRRNFFPLINYQFLQQLISSNSIIMDGVFNLVKQFDTTIVYGNLGRRPYLVQQYLIQNFAHYKILIVSKYYKFESSENVHAVLPDEVRAQKCDLLIYVEPPPHTNVTKKPRNAARLLILTSHLVLTLPTDETSTLVTYFHNANKKRIQQLLALQDASMQSDRIDSVKMQIDFFPVVSIGPVSSDITVGNNISPPLERTSYVVVNLTHAVSSMAMMLYFWDAFDYMVDHLESIKGWLICFPENGAFLFTSFTQECIDRLFCKRLDSPPLSELLALLPFYKSGIVDTPRNQKLNRDQFLQMEYVAPESIEILLKTFVQENLIHVMGNVYLIK